MSVDNSATTPSRDRYTKTFTPNIKLGVSSCLLGEHVRYDGGHKHNAYIVGTLSDYFTFESFCPEMAIGLGVPRPAIHLVKQSNDDIRCVGVKDSRIDVTEQLVECTDSQKSWHESLCGYILKKDSPSCGMERVKLYTNNQPRREGVGIYAGQLIKNLPYLPVEEEGRLGDARLRENFIQRVYVLYRWKSCVSQGLTPSILMNFHSQHKLIIMSRDQNKARTLGHLVAQVTKDSLDNVANQYINELMITLKQVASVGNHVNVLQHIQGYLKRQLDAADKAELCETLEQYRFGNLPLIVPITLLKHHFRKAPNEFINSSYYMNPYPAEMKLLNSL